MHRMFAWVSLTNCKMPGSLTVFLVQPKGCAGDDLTCLSNI